MRILVADDDAVTRKLLTELLRRRGHITTGARDGHEALAALDQQDFDIVLMDEQMPGMTGIETARAILQRSTPGRKRPAIIGLSGNSTEEDERRCLEAGMDSFLGKPVRMEALYHVVDLLTPWPSPAPLPQTTWPQLAEPSQDLAGHLRRATGGNEKLLRSLVKTFLADAPKVLSTLRRALARKEPRALARAAHTLKGSLAIFGAEKAAAAARALQALGQAGRLDGAPEELRALESEIELLRAALLDLVPASPKRTTSQRRRSSRPRRKR